jgi:hypothetical protein
MVCVVSHTHWDREWYHGAERFGQRLTALIDALLRLPAGTLERTPFLLDGQAIALRDYLSRRPSQRQRLQEALQAGRIEAGPWFVLGDNLIPSGEAIVRNLEAGRRLLSSLGVSPPPVAYCPDTFGHPAAMPLIARGFGLEVAVVWRGAGGMSGPSEDAFRWIAPNGDAVVACHLPPDGYEYGSALPTGFGATRQRWQQLQTLFDARNRSGVVLLLNGADHHARQPDLEAALEALQAAAGAESRVEAVSLTTWAARFQTAARHMALPSQFGELRDSYGYTWTLGGTLATRAHQKRRNARLERGLVCDVEPWIAVARLHDRFEVFNDGRLGMEQLPELLSHTWETLLETHPHDTLCGCSIDQVAGAMDQRQDAVADAGRGLREAALQLVLQHDAVAARSRAPASGHAPVVVRNRSARARGGLTHLTIRKTLADVPVGPGSADAPTAIEIEVPASAGVRQAQMLGRPRLTWERRESPQHYPDNDLVAEYRMLAWMPEVPALGLSAWHTDAIPETEDPAPVRLEDDGGSFHLDNGHVHVAISQHGHVAVRVDDRLVSRALWVESCSDDGDSYTPSPGTPIRLRVNRVRAREAGPLRAAVDIMYSIGAASAAGAERGDVHVVVTLRLSAGSEAVECQVRVTNRRTNHRLRLVWGTDVVDGEVWADSAFGPIYRPSLVAPAHAREAVPDGMPLHRWMLHWADNGSAALVSDGLAEGDVQAGRLAVTLLRSIGALSRATIPERPGHAGWPVAIPDAQCQGTYSARVALLLMRGPREAVLAKLGHVCDDILLPLMGETWRDLELDDAGAHCAGPSLQGTGLHASAVTISQNDPQSVVLRAVNCLDHEVRGLWRLPMHTRWIVTPCRLDETPLGDSVIHGSDVPFIAQPRATVTFLVKRSIA